MSTPDRIWIDGAVNANVWAEQKTDCTLSGVAAYEYVRADLCAKSEAISPTQDERVKALVGVLRTLSALLADGCVGERGKVVAARLDAALRALEQGEG